MKITLQMLKDVFKNIVGATFDDCVGVMVDIQKQMAFASQGRGVTDASYLVLKEKMEYTEHGMHTYDQTTVYLDLWDTGVELLDAVKADVVWDGEMKTSAIRELFDDELIAFMRERNWRVYFGEQLVEDFYRLDSDSDWMFGENWDT